MKSTIYTLAVTTLIAGAILTACQTPAQKEEAAQGNVQTAKEELKEAKQEVNPAYPDFKRDAQQQIADNDKRIATLSAKVDKNGNAPLDNLRRQKIEDLEKRNAELTAKLTGYEAAPSDWEAFKLGFNHDEDKLRDAFNDFGNDLKKKS